MCSDKNALTFWGRERRLYGEVVRGRLRWEKVGFSWIHVGGVWIEGEMRGVLLDWGQRGHYERQARDRYSWGLERKDGWNRWLSEKMEVVCLESKGRSAHVIWRGEADRDGLSGIMGQGLQVPIHPYLSNRDTLPLRSVMGSITKQTRPIFLACQMFSLVNSFKNYFYIKINIDTLWGGKWNNQF